MRHCTGIILFAYYEDKRHQFRMEDLVKAIRRVRGIDYPQSQAPLLEAEKDARMRRFRADVHRLASRAASSIIFIIVR